jgi:hypothetical protein
MEGKKKLGLPSVVATGVGVIVATSCLLSVGHFLRTVQYMPVCFAREHPKVCVNLQTDVR